MRSGGERWPATPSRRDRRTEPSKYGEFRPPSQLRDSHPHPPMQRSHQEPQRVAPARLLSRSCALYLWLLQKSLQRALSNLQRTPTRESKQGERTADSSAATHRIEPAPGFTLVAGARHASHLAEQRTNPSRTGLLARLCRDVAMQTVRPDTDLGRPNDDEGTFLEYPL